MLVWDLDIEGVLIQKIHSETVLVWEGVLNTDSERFNCASVGLEQVSWILRVS